MLIATSILAAATVVLAIEGAAFLRNWLTSIRPGSTRRELDQLRSEIGELRSETDQLRRRTDLLQHAAWLSVSATGQSYEVADKVRSMVMLDGWRPDDALRGEVRDYSLGRLMDTGGVDLGYRGPGSQPADDPDQTGG
jgi:hypothetical protein